MRLRDHGAATVVSFFLDHAALATLLVNAAISTRSRQSAREEKVRSEKCA
jgi:hypothetical protein